MFYLRLLVCSLAMIQNGDETSIVAPGGNAPEIGIVEGIRNEKLLFLTMHKRPGETFGSLGPRWIKVYRRDKLEELEQALKNNQEVSQFFKDMRKECVLEYPVREEHELKHVSLYNKTGKPIPRSEWAALLAKPRLVVFKREFGNSQIDPVYLNALRDDTPLLVLPIVGGEEYAVDLEPATTSASTATIPPALGTDTQAPANVKQPAPGEAQPAPAARTFKPGIKYPAPIAKFASGGIVPSLGIVDGVQDGKLLFRENGTGATRSQRERKDLDEVSIYNAQGTPLPRESWPTVFARPGIVLFARCDLDNEIPVDPAYLATLRTEVPLVVLNHTQPDEIEKLQVPSPTANPNQPRPVIANGGIAPGISVVDGVRDGQLQFRKIDVRTEGGTTMFSGPITVMSPEGIRTTRNGMRTKEFVIFKIQNQLVPYDVANVEIYDKQGQPVARKHWENLFRTPGIVLFARKGTGTPVDPAFLAATREGTLLVVLPEIKGDQPTPNAAAPNTTRPSTPATVK